MKFKILLLTVLITSISFGQSRSFFTENSSYNLHDDIIEYESEIKSFKSYHLDLEGLDFFLSAAPNRFEGIKSTVRAKFPNADGELQSYEIYEASSFSNELKEKFPNIKTYVGKNLDQKATNIRITITPQGFFGYITSPKKSTYINPLTKDARNYMVFDKKYASIEEEKKRVCELSGHEDVDFDLDELENQVHSQNLIEDGVLRKYRFALACTSQYANFHLNAAGVPTSAPTSEKLETVQAAMAVSIDRVNSIYERDFSITLEFVDNNESLIQLNSFSDPYTNSSGGAMLGQNQTQVDNIIGSSNYDIGHVFSTGGGGVAFLGSVCNTNNKAGGVTGLPAPVGDPFDVDYVSHEIGHQFGATHTQNNNCQRTIQSAMEPGSGSTIMGYAGICFPNVQNSSDDHFHYVSVFQVENVITSFSGGCAEEISISNTSPTITLESNYTIPNSTPFFLDVEATDAEDDDLTYNWEQLNNQISEQPPVSTSTVGPNFRSFPSTEESRRYFPAFPTVLAGNTSTTWEVVPTVPRSMTFSLLVRDNNILGGQNASSTVNVNFAEVGPFTVTSPTSFNTFERGNEEEITWNVAGTDANGINTTEVNIFLSTDGGQNFEEIANGVPNNGSYLYDVPEDLFTDAGLIMVQGKDNIFYALSGLFSVVDAFEFDCTEFERDISVDIPDGVGSNDPGPVATSSIQVFTDDAIERVRVGVDIDHTWINDLVITLVSPSGDEVILFDRECGDEDGIFVSFSDDGGPIPNDCPNPLTGVFMPSEGELSVFNGSSSAGNWTLEIQDFWNGDTGTLNSWFIELCGENLSIQEEVSAAFSIYPNPSNGTFNINFSNGLSPDASGRVFDINGKLIQKIDLSKAGRKTTVQLENVSTGIYLIEIENNGTRSVEKLIIK